MDKIMDVAITSYGYLPYCSEKWEKNNRGSLNIAVENTEDLNLF